MLYESPIKCNQMLHFYECRKANMLELLRALAAKPPEGIAEVTAITGENVDATAALPQLDTETGSCLTLEHDEIKGILQTQRQAVTIDFDWLHEIGSGCDDTELPHHVSAEYEIEELICAVEDVLGTLPKPKLITVARYIRVYCLLYTF